MKIFLGGIVWRDVTVPHHMAMMWLIEYLKDQRIDYEYGVVPGDALVSRSRSIAASVFLRSDCDVMLMIDSDIQFRAEDAVNLCRKALDKRLIAAMYLTRNVETQPALMLPDEPVIFDDSAKPVEAPYISTGFMAVTKTVFQTLAEDLPLCHKGWTDKGADTSFHPFFMPFVVPSEGEGHMYLSEDWAFVHRAKEAGFTAWLDPSIRLVHGSTEGKTLEDLVRPPRIPARPLRLTRDAEGHLRTEVLEPSQIPQEV